ncbi:MAG: hypothetical protein HKP20_07490, partial [Akkermansiaceae bacterium]|nr:hypothetical protein [Akkermansiaceae bacterium]
MVRDNRFLGERGIQSAERLRQFAKWAPKAHADIWAMQEVIYLKEDQ